MTWKKSYKIFCNTLDSAISNLDEEKVQNLINIINNTNRNLFFCGIGKNAYVSKHIVATYNSLSIQSYFIDPVDAIHGDMGILKDGDVLIILTKSGNTQEIIDFVDKINKNVTKILIHSNEKSILKNKVDHDIFLKIETEIDQSNIVPTSSLITYLAFLQSLSIEVIERRNFKINNFFDNHPGGSIGKIKNDVN